MTEVRPSYRWVADAAALDALVAELAAAERYALDTEFHRERTYYPKAALIQIAWAGGLVLVDPLAVDVKPLAIVLDGPGLAVLHAAQQDLDVLDRVCGTIPARLFDTQLAAGFVGWSSPSLSNLVAGELGENVPKGDRLTDWLRRPLTADQLAYAATDVEHLLRLHDVLLAKLDERGRRAWAEDECERLRTRPVAGSSPDEAWQRLKDARTLRPKARGVARAVAAWRERRAMAADQPARFILPDLAVLAIAQRSPRTADDLRGIRGVEERHTRGDMAKGILAAVAEGLELPAELPTAATETDLDRQLRPAVTLVSAWVSQLARSEDIDTMLLATRSDLIELLAGVPGARLREGWRGELIGSGITQLVDGRAALAFDGKGGLRLLPVSDGAAVVGATAPASPARASGALGDPAELGVELIEGGGHLG